MAKGDDGKQLPGLFRGMVRLKSIILGGGGFSSKTYKPGDVLMEEGQEGKRLFLINRGKVEIRKATEDGGYRSLGTRDEGEIMGEMALFDDKPHSASVVAVENTEASVMSRKEFQDQMENMDPFMREVVRVVIKRGRHMTEMLAKQEKEGGGE